MNEKKIKLRKIMPLYFFIFILGGVLIAPTHLFPPPLFMPIRFPHYLEQMGTFLGVSWPATFEIYHYVLYVLIAIGSINVLGLIFYPKFKQMTIVSSLTGLFLITLIILFFFFVFINVNASTAAIYGLYCVVLLIVDLLTFKFLTKRRKEE